MDMFVGFDILALNSKHNYVICRSDVATQQEFRWMPSLFKSKLSIEHNTNESMPVSVRTGDLCV